MVFRGSYPFLPYGRQVIEDDDIAAVDRRAARRLPDHRTDRRDFSSTPSPRRSGAAQAVACNSGTAALHLAAMALGLGRNDWLIVPSMTFLATANAARYVGAEVEFADVDPDTGLLTEATLAEALERAKRAGRSVKAVSVVHLAGRTAPMRAIARAGPGSADRGGRLPRARHHLRRCRIAGAGRRWAPWNARHLLVPPGEDHRGRRRRDDHDQRCRACSAHAARAQPRHDA